MNYTQAYADTLNAATGSTVGSTTLVGWTAGAGWEWAWTDHLSVKTVRQVSDHERAGCDSR